MHHDVDVVDVDAVVPEGKGTDTSRTAPPSSQSSTPTATGLVVVGQDVPYPPKQVNMDGTLLQRYTTACEELEEDVVANMREYDLSRCGCHPRM